MCRAGLQLRSDVCSFVLSFVPTHPLLQKKLPLKGGKKKKQALKFTLDCTHPVEDGIMDAANFVSYQCVRPLR